MKTRIRMMCRGPRRWRWLFVIFLMTCCLLIVKFAQYEEPDTQHVHKTYLHIPNPNDALSITFPQTEKWDLEHLLATDSVHRSSHRRFNFPATKVSMCNESGIKAYSPCVDVTCNKTFDEIPEDSLKKVESYPQTGVNELITKLRNHMTSSRTAAKLNPNTVIIVTGASSSYFHQSQGVIETIHDRLMKKYFNVHLVFYDLGLQRCQRKLVEKFCGCEVKDFPFWLFPAHVYKDLKSFAWKPLVILLELLHHRYVTWMDSSIRLLDQDFHLTYQLPLQHGISVAYGNNALAQHTSLAMFRWFNEDPCLFSPYYEIQTGYIIIYKNSYTMNYIVKPWVACALNEDCISPDSNQYCDDSVRQYGKCHHRDESALSIILTRLYQKSRELLHLTKFTVMKLQHVHYFPEEPNWHCLLW